MLRQEFAIGDYLAKYDCDFETMHSNRRMTILLIYNLNNLKRWKIDTFFSAVSLVDRYLAHTHLE